MLTQELKDYIKKHSLEEKNKECCGLIYKNPDSNLGIFRCGNASDIPKEHFFINPKEFVEASCLGDIIGIYHSHVEKENFSFLDKTNANGHALIFVMYNIKNDFFKIYYPQSNNNTYINKAFQIGKVDCFSLVREYYKEEFDIEIPDYPRTEAQLEEYSNMFSKRFNEGNFSIIIDGQITKDNFSKLKENDILIFRDKNEKESHMAIYLGGNTILHHRRNKLSCMEPFHQIYKDKTVFTVRHNSFIK